MSRLPLVRYRLARFLARWRRPLAGCCAALTVGGALLALHPPPAATVDVVVAARDLTGAEPLAPGDVSVRAMPESAAPEGALPAAEPLDGAALSGPLRRGEVLTTARLADPPAAGYGPDLVAAPVRVADPGAAALVAPGSRVDLLAARGTAEFSPDHMRAPEAELVAADRPVIAVPEAETGGEGGSLLVVAVSEGEARELAGHAAGSRISITIRG